MSEAEQIADFDSQAHATLWAFFLSTCVRDSQESTWKNPRWAQLAA